MRNLKDSKEIHRRVLVNVDNRIEPRRTDYCNMTIYPSGVIGFKQGRRPEIIISISSVYRIAMAREIENNKPQKKAARVSRGLLSTFRIK